MNVHAMLNEWDKQFGRAAWLPALRGQQHAPGRAAILAALHEGSQDFGSHIAVFRREVANALGINVRQTVTSIDEDILVAFHKAIQTRGHGW